MELSRLHICFCSLSIIVLVGIPLPAQVITGSITGTVRDATGGVLPGAEVSIRSPALMTGNSTTTTNEKGRFRVPALPPGTYTLIIQAPGFTHYVEEGVRVQVGGSVEKNVFLELASVSEEVVVSGEGPVVDKQKTAVSTNYGKEYMESVPLRRYGVYDFIKSAPGISATQPTNNFDLDVSAFGSGVNENTFLVDGSPTRAPGTDAIEEIEIVSLGASAEYGNFQGAVFNVVTRQGGNDWRFDVSYFTTSGALTSQPAKLECECPEGETGFVRERFHDVTAYVGGPILQDRLWIYGGFEYHRDYKSQPGWDPQYYDKWKTDQRFLKLTWQITPKLKSTHSYHRESTFYPLVGDWAAAEALASYAGDYPSVTLAHLTYTMTDHTVWDIRASGTFYDYDTEPNSGNRTSPLHFDLATGKFTHGTFYLNTNRGKQFSLRSKVNHYKEDLFRGDHDFKAGVQFQYEEIRTSETYAGGAIYYDYNGAPVYAEFGEPSGWGAGSRSLGAYIEDAFHIGERVTLNWGLRFDYNRAISQDIPALNSLGEETEEIIQGLGTFYTWNTLAPRLGFNLGITEDGRTVLRGTWGRFYGGIYHDEHSWLHPAMTPVILANYDPATGEYSDVLLVSAPMEKRYGFDPDMKTPRTDQFSIGLDRELGSNLAIGVTYSRKDGRHFTGWKDTQGVYGTKTATFPDGRTLEVYPLLSDYVDRFFLLTNPEDYYLTYNGLTLILNKRWTSQWQMLVSYTLSEARGLQASQGNFTQNSAGGTLSYGRDPNDLINADAVLSNDRTHMLRSQGSFVIPKIDVTLGINFQHQTGKPWMAKTYVLLPQGRRKVFLEPRGSRRFPAQTLLDVRVSKILRFRERDRLELVADILNLLNDTAVTMLTSDDYYGPDFGKPSWFVEPRSLMLGVKLSF